MRKLINRVAPSPADIILDPFMGSGTTGVAAIPVSAFYERDPVTTILRLCLSKRNETLDAGVDRLAKARELSQASAQCLRPDRVRHLCGSVGSVF